MYERDAYAERRKRTPERIEFHVASPKFLRSIGWIAALVLAAQRAMTNRQQEQKEPHVPPARSRSCEILARQKNARGVLAAAAQVVGPIKVWLMNAGLAEHAQALGAIAVQFEPPPPLRVGDLCHGLVLESKLRVVRARALAIKAGSNPRDRGDPHGSHAEISKSDEQAIYDFAIELTRTACSNATFERAKKNWRDQRDRSVGSLATQPGVGNADAFGLPLPEARSCRLTCESCPAQLCRAQRSISAFTRVSTRYERCAAEPGPLRTPASGTVPHLRCTAISAFTRVHSRRRRA